jgi:ABC-type cobalamin/Fe3+-siderophores transport system ATPase subunit
VIETALSLEGFSLIVDGKKMLDNVSLEVPKGNIALLQGARGSGKSAILRSFIHPTKSSSMMSNIRDQ